MKKLAVLIFLILPMLLSAQRSIIVKGAELETLAGSFSFTEGPIADAKGNVYFTDQPNNKIYIWTVKDELKLFSDDAGRSNGTFMDRDGSLLACADMDNQLWKFDSEGYHTVLVKDYDGKLLNGPNDLWVDPKGGIYFTDPMYARDYWTRDPQVQQDGEHVYYLLPDRKTLIRVTDDLGKPNGIIGTPDGKLLYVADMGQRRTYRYEIAPDGTLTNKTLFAGMGSDGMTIDNRGNIYLTGRGVTVFSPQGEQIAQIPIAGGWTANVCFGGRKLNYLYITQSENLHRLKMNVKGVRNKKI